EHSEAQFCTWDIDGTPSAGGLIVLKNDVSEIKVRTLLCFDRSAGKAKAVHEANPLDREFDSRPQHEMRPLEGGIQGRDGTPRSENAQRPEGVDRILHEGPRRNLQRVTTMVVECLLDGEHVLPQDTRRNTLVAQADRPTSAIQVL